MSFHNTMVSVRDFAKDYTKSVLKIQINRIIFANQSIPAMISSKNSDRIMT